MAQDRRLLKIPGEQPADDENEDLPLVDDDEGTDLVPLPQSTVDEAVSIPDDDVSLDIGELPDSLSGESVSVITVDDTETSGLDPFDSLAAEASPPVVLPWKTSARFPALARTIPCTCDPTAATSQLVIADGPGSPTRELQIIIGALNDTFVLPIVIGTPEHLILGRDVLAGRVWVDSSALHD